MLINQCEGNYSWPTTKLHTALFRKGGIRTLKQLLKFNITVSRGQLSFYRQFRSF
uniref:Uncharacterized protein n=3 Tax=Homininae TaxID=207598 RepID=A0A2I3TK41_PANTR